MRNEFVILFDRNPDIFLFLRENPFWHHELSVHPERYKEFVEEYKTKRRKHFSDRIEDISMMLSLAKELM